MSQEQQCDKSGVAMEFATDNWICLKGEHDGAKFQVMTDGNIKIEVDGSVHVRTVREWHAAAVQSFTHNDHPLRLFDRTCPACTSESGSAPSTTRQIKTIDYAITLLEIEGNAEKVLQYLREARDQHVLTLPSRELLREQIKADPDIESSTSAPSAMGTKSVERARDAFSLDATNLQHDLDEQTATAGLLAATVKVLNEELASLSELDSLFAKFDEAQPDYLTVYLTLPQHDFWAQVVEYFRKRRADGGKQTDG